MPLSPNLLQRLAELKKWQESHEDLLKKTIINTSANATTLSDYQTIDGLSAFDSSNEHSRKNWESQVISPTKTFHELLEEKLALDPGPGAAPPKPKRPFLKKGAGLERFRMKTRPKLIKKSKGEKENDNVTPLRAPDLVVRPKATWGPPGEQTLYEKALEKELRIFEALEEKAENSSFCSTNSSVVRILSSTPSKKGGDDVIETELERKDIAEILLRLKNLAEGRMKPPDVPSIIEASDEDKWTSSEVSSVSSGDLEETLTAPKRDIGVGTEASNDCAICGDKLKKKIIEYDDKLNDLIEDKNRISELRKQLEQKERDFLKRKHEFEDQRANFEYEADIERKKLAKERQAFQMFMKESQNRPNKKERQEISNLKQEVADLSETLKLKESKNGMTQARLRNQIKQLEKENSQLKTEIEKLTKENAKLSATQKLNRKSSDSKILHEINKNITKLTNQAKNHEKNVMLDQSESFLVMAPPLADECNNGGANQSETSAFNSNQSQVTYPNGNIKTVSPDGNFITVKFFNGDRQETNLLDGTVKYFFTNRNITQTTFADGLEVVEFPEGVIERRFPDGRCEITLPDGAVQTTLPDGGTETKYTDGSIVKIAPNGDKVLLLANGQKEIETKEYKSREYPDGTVKILYRDGTQETKYANGRVRIKDSNGKLVLDTHL
ncbi:centromere protein J [Tribolium castaneum]|uniref:Centromere protein J-like Protein n=1 Tax=Tribolium castaneum TaxID=7070 RepID=D2A5C4_TRICA|nr:PREDICTED: centromere protein J [Tribolium castaneum]EFA05098.1 Centromere protein J-like Protein [Tribolium castaneum]|eukprot:XP_974227.1 PREDICTED: centromere protein J [Tribolium castaneum]